jgi:hypothetical protein
MAKPRRDLSAFVGKLLDEEQDGDVLREVVCHRSLTQYSILSATAGGCRAVVARRNALTKGAGWIPMVRVPMALRALALGGTDGEGCGNISRARRSWMGSPARVVPQSV